MQTAWPAHLQLTAALLLGAFSIAKAQPSAHQSSATQSSAPQSSAPQSSATQFSATQSSATQADRPSAGLAAQIFALVAEPAVAHAHWGIMVTSIEGVPIFALNEGQFFQPASNVKLFTTAAALALLGRDATVKTTVTAVGVFAGKEHGLAGMEHLKGDLYLSGAGDANLSGRAVPYARNTEEAFFPLRYLDDLAEQVAQTGVKTVDGDVVGVALHEAWQPYPPGWSVDDLPWGYGAPVSRLSIGDNEVKLTVRPAAEVSSRAVIESTPAVAYFTVTNDVMTVAAGSETHIEIERSPGSKQLRIYGRIALKAAPEVEHIAVTDPVEFAAVAFKELLEQHGIAVTGHARAEHALPQDARAFREVAQQPVELKKMLSVETAAAMGVYDCPTPQEPAACPRSTIVASHTSPALKDDVTLTNKLSLNLHAELLALRLGDRFTFEESVEGNAFAEGARVIRQFAVDAGIGGDDLVFYDGSGLSSYDEVTPRAIARLLRFASTQAWFRDYKASLPIGGVDGTLESRFAKPPLKGRVFAKTGTMGEARALSGYLECASGRTVIFSILDSNHAPGTSADRDAMDRIVAAIAAAD